MTKRDDLQSWVVQALEQMGGAGTIVQVAEHIWEHHQNDLKSSGDLFYTWQYDMRWEATKLRKRKIIRPANVSLKGQWILK